MNTRTIRRFAGVSALAIAGALSLSLAGCSSGGAQTSCGDFISMSHDKQISVAKKAAKQVKSGAYNYDPPQADDAEGLEDFASRIASRCSSNDYTFTASDPIEDTFKSVLD